jgi:hypothetical protein
MLLREVSPEARFRGVEPLLFRRRRAPAGLMEQPDTTSVVVEERETANPESVLSSLRHRRGREGRVDGRITQPPRLQDRLEYRGHNTLFPISGGALLLEKGDRVLRPRFI